jgi:chromosome segregation ATPase
VPRPHSGTPLHLDHARITLREALTKLEAREENLGHTINGAEAEIDQAKLNLTDVRRQKAELEKALDQLEAAQKEATP